VVGLTESSGQDRLSTNPRLFEELLELHARGTFSSELPGATAGPDRFRYLMT
jgi:hypothetical protein